MIAIQTVTNNQTARSKRAHDGSRGSPPTYAQNIIDNNNATKRATPSPVADDKWSGKWGGGGAESSRRRGSSSDALSPMNATQPTNPSEHAAPYNPAQPHILPKDINESQLLDALLDGSFTLPQLCEHFEFPPTDLLAWLESPETNQVLATLAKIADIRANMIAAQTRVAATHRLSELARHGHITDSPREARANETARKAAAQLLRTGTTALRAVSLQVRRISEPTTSALIIKPRDVDPEAASVRSVPLRTPTHKRVLESQEIEQVESADAGRLVAVGVARGCAPGP